MQRSYYKRLNDFWKEIEYKKVQAEIQRVIDCLLKEGKIF